MSLDERGACAFGQFPRAARRAHQPGDHAQAERDARVSSSSVAVAIADEQVAARQLLEQSRDEMTARILRAMQVYGLIVADNGSDMYISGTMDFRWNNDELNPAFGALRASDFEVVQLGWR
jgi:hypothetical protein